ncbi:hypothetical protein V2J09_020908 [Rumex salicifolius]
MEECSAALVDETYEYSAPRFYDFSVGETEEEKMNSELWFETAISHAPSPVMPKIKIGRDVQINLDFSDADQITKALEPSESINTASNDANGLKMNPEQKLIRDVSSTEISEENKIKESLNEASKISFDDKSCKVAEEIPKENGSIPTTASPDEIVNADVPIFKTQIPEAECTPKPPVLSAKRDQSLAMSRRQQTARKIASLIKNPSALKTKNGQSQLSQTKCTKPASARKDINQKTSAGTPNLVQENQAIKRQKLEGGQSRKILNIKPQNLTHKSRLGLTTSSARTTIGDSTAKTRKEDRKVYVREPAAAPFVSMAEMVKKFQSSTRDVSLSQASHGKQHVLALTRPKEPEFETSQRVRSIKLKSTAELEEETMAKMPKFKARRLNKKIFDAPTLPPMPKSVIHPTEFQEFHLETMARATKNAETSSVVSTESSRHQNNNQWMPRLTEPKTPLLQTSLRARPTNVKTSLEIEQEELEKIPKFKARPLNKKIFESKGDMGLFCNNKKQVTVPQEFHFAMDERIPPPPPPAAMVVDLFDKLSISSESCSQMPRKTKPNPFHLHTEERGAEKERRFYTELIHKEIEEEKSRIHKANPYPFTTDFPVIPPKPEPKQCTRPEPFQLESLMRHEMEIQRETEERQRKEKEEAQMRVFKAQPVLKEDPIPLPEKERKPLTQVQGFNLHIEHRAAERAEFDKKVKEKERMYKRYREEADSATMMEEEKALKQLRRTLVPRARPVPKFPNPFVPQKSSRETTKAKSPKLRVDQRKERHNMVRAMAAALTKTSSSASQMR